MDVLCAAECIIVHTKDFVTGNVLNCMLDIYAHRLTEESPHACQWNYEVTTDLPSLRPPGFRWSQCGKLLF